MAKTTSKSKASFEEVKVEEASASQPKTDVELVENTKSVETVKIEEEVKQPSAPLKDTIEPMIFDKNGIASKFKIEGNAVTFGAAVTRANKKCEWDLVVGADGDKEPIDDDLWKPLPGYNAKYVKTTILNFQKKPMDVYLVKTKTELQFWVID